MIIHEKYIDVNIKCTNILVQIYTKRQWTIGVNRYNGFVTNHMKQAKVEWSTERESKSKTKGR